MSATFAAVFLGYWIHHQTVTTYTNWTVHLRRRFIQESFPVSSTTPLILQVSGLQALPVVPPLLTLLPWRSRSLPVALNTRRFPSPLSKPYSCLLKPVQIQFRFIHPSDWYSLASQSSIGSQLAIALQLRSNLDAKGRPRPSPMFVSGAYYQTTEFTPLRFS